MRKKFWTIQVFKTRPKRRKTKGKREFGAGDLVIFIISLCFIVIFGYFSYLIVINSLNKKVDQFESSKPRLAESIFQDATKDWQVYDNQNFKYQVKLPAEAKKEDLTNGAGANFTLDNEIKISIFAQKNETGETINSSLDNKQAELESKEKKVKLIEKRNESLSGQTALSESWSYRDVDNNDRDMILKRVAVSVSGNIYIFDFSAPTKKFEETEETFDLIIQSFKIL